MNEETHKINQIKAVNPQLAKLINRVQVIHLVTGGKVVKKQNSKRISKYEIIKEEIKAKIYNIICIQERLESGLYSIDSKDYIAMKNTLRGEYTQLSNDIIIFTNQFKDNIDPEEVIEQQDIMSQVKNILPKYKQIVTQNEYKGTVNTVDDLLSGKLGRVKQEVITGEQQEILNEINSESKKQDDILDIMSGGLEDLKHLANTIKDTVSAQNTILETITDKADHNIIMVTNASDRTKDLLKKVNSISGKLCTYIICIIILLALVLLAYNIIKK